MKSIPKFKTRTAAAEFWETHSFEEFRKDTRKAEIVFVKKPKKTIALRLDPEDILSAEKIAEEKGLSYTALLRMWIRERLSQEHHRAT